MAGEAVRCDERVGVALELLTATSDLIDGFWRISGMQLTGPALREAPPKKERKVRSVMFVPLSVREAPRNANLHVVFHAPPCDAKP